MKVYAVQFSNYDPAEIAGLYESREDAERRADELNDEYDSDMWDVSEWTVMPVSKEAAERMQEAVG